MNLLHLSDLHIERLDQATLWSNQLAEDLRLRCGGNCVGLEWKEALIGVK